VIGVLAVRGGLGVSTVASNLAAALFNRAQADVILAELTPGQGTLGMDLNLPAQAALAEMLRGTPAEVTREKVQSSLAAHNSGLKILAASDNPRDVDLSTRAENFELLVIRLASLARFVILDLGSGLSSSMQKILPRCKEQIVVMEGMPNSIQHTRVLLNELADLKMDLKSVSVVLNNRQRSDSQIPWAQAQERLGHPVATTLTPLPELFTQALRLHTPAVLAQPENMVSQQFLKLADAVLEREKAR
jgi:pilus assembly protein CpaE